MFHAKLRVNSKHINKRNLTYIAIAVMLIAILFLLPLVEVSISFTYKKTEKGLIYRNFIVESYNEIHHETNWLNPFDKQKWSDEIKFYLTDNKEIQQMLKEYPFYKAVISKLTFDVKVENEKYAKFSVEILGILRTFENPKDGFYEISVDGKIEKISVTATFDIELKPYSWSMKSAKITISDLKLYVTVWFGSSEEDITTEITENVNETETSLGGLVFNIPHFGPGQHFDFWVMVSWIDYAFSLSIIAVLILLIYCLKGGRKHGGKRNRKRKR